MKYRRIELRLFVLIYLVWIFSANSIFSQNIVENSGFKKDSFSLFNIGNQDNIDNNYIRNDIMIRNIWVDKNRLKSTKSPGVPDAPGGLGTYYISPFGDDSNSGTSPEEAWQTIDKVNSIDFGPGDEILFEGGKTFKGSLSFDTLDCGTALNYVEVNSYGTGRAVINGETGNGFLAKGCEYFNIKNLNFIGDGRKTGNTGDGIVMDSCSNINVDNIDISGFQHSGLIVANKGNNFHITNIYAHENGFCGLCVIGTTKTSITNVYIGHCIANNNPGDPTILNNHSGNGILAYNANNIIIEYCEASNNGWDMPRTGNGPGGIWMAEVDSAVIQYCISHDNKTSVGGKDGLGFDLDGGTTNSIIQYCLSYNNQGAGYGIFQYFGATGWSNNTVRYCISENDGNVSGEGSIIFWNGSNNTDDFKDFEFYNNVVYNINGPALAFIDHKNLNFNFRNNIFFSKRNSAFGGITIENFQGNCWYSNSGQFQIGGSVLEFEDWAISSNQEMLNGELIGMFANPELINPGNTNLTDTEQMTEIDDYKVQENSVVIDTGLDLQSLFSIDPGQHDYFGNTLKQGIPFNIGVYQNIDKQVINFNAGWNIMSLSVMPGEADLLNILQPLINAGNLKKIMNEDGEIIEDWGVSNGGWQNTIGNLEITEGYKINVTSEALLEISGIPTKIPLDIPLKEGWNIISWPIQIEQNGIDVFQDLIISGKLKKVMDELGNVIEDWGTNGGWQNNIGTLKPGEGYKVNVTSNCTLTISENVTKSESIITKLFTSTYFVPAYYGNGTDHMNINLVNLSESGIKEGDEIGIFDGEICVGSARIASPFSGSFSTSISIPVSAIDGIESKNGYSDGNPVTIKLFRNGKQYSLRIVPLKNSKAVFKRGGSLFARIDVSTAIEKTASFDFPKINVYPNPFNDNITIDLDLEKDADIYVVVLNQMGQRVNNIATKQQMPGGMHKFIWDGKNESNQSVSAGLYYLKIWIDDFILHHKIIYSN